MKNVVKILAILVVAMNTGLLGALDTLGWVARKVTGNYAYICGRHLSSHEKNVMRISDSHHPQTDVFAAPNSQDAARNCGRGDLYKVRSNGALSKK